MSLDSRLRLSGPPTTYPDLVRNHMTGPGAFPEMLAPLTKNGNGQIETSTGKLNVHNTVQDVY